MCLSARYAAVLFTVYDFPDFLLSRDFAGKKFKFSEIPGLQNYHEDGKMSDNFVWKIYWKLKKVFTYNNLQIFLFLSQIADNY